MRLAIAGHGARPVVDGKPHVVGALVRAELGALVGLQIARSACTNGGTRLPRAMSRMSLATAEAVGLAAGAGPDQQQVAAVVAVDGDAFVTPETSAIAECLRHHRRIARAASMPLSVRMATPSSLMR